MALIYYAAPYTAPTREGIEANIQKARKGAIELFEYGYNLIVPHTMTAHMDRDCNIPVEAWYEHTLELMTKCDAIYMAPGWRDSKGCRNELDVARRLWIPAFFGLSELLTNCQGSFLSEAAQRQRDSVRRHSPSINLN